MTLKEFMETEDNRGFVEDKIATMQNHVEFCLISMKKGADFEYKEHLETVEQSYYAIYGYIMAAYAYGRISQKDKSTLVGEVIELSKVQ